MFKDGDLGVNKDGVRIVSQSKPQVLLRLSDFDIVKVIGKGSIGVVLLIKHKWTGQFLALKVIQLNTNKAIRKAIAHELKISRSLQCPYLVNSYQSFYNNGSISLILEYMDGGSLADFLKSVKIIPEAYLSAIFKQVLQGLIYLHHEKHIIHRDFKPSNLLINHRGEVKITDFVVSTVMTNTAGLANTFIGTYNYMSPERIVGKEYGNKSDIWSLGLVVLECATGKFPYAPPCQHDTWTSVFELIEAIVDEPPPALPSGNFSPELSSFISTCLQKNPNSRSSAKELMEHPFLNKYNGSAVNLASYFTDAGSPLATLGNLPGTKIGSIADVTSRNHSEDWGSFCEFLKNRQPPRLLCECTASDAIEFVRLFPPEKIEAVVSGLSTTWLRKVDGNFMDNPFESPVVRSFLTGVLKEQTSEGKKGDGITLKSETNRNLKETSSQLNSILSLLNCSQSSVPHIVGLWGMAGIGKTAIAKEIFRTLAERYDVCYFLPDFHLMYQTKGLTCLRDEFISRIFGEDNVFIDTCDTKVSFTRDRFLNRRLLIVLDGVSNARDAEVLVGGFGWFSAGHTIILTSRNRQVLVQCNAKETYEIQKLSEPESFQLCRHLTTEKTWKGRMSLISELVNYASGNPLALRVLGSSIQNQCINDEKHLRKLRQHPPVEIQDAFRGSFHGLDDNEKSTFLDLACFFRGEDKDRVVNILDGCGIFTDLGVYGLLDESLISLVDNKIEMPNIFQDMGRFFVCQEHVEACKRSRLWDASDIAHVLINNSGTEAIEGIFLDESGLMFELSPNVFERMYRLRLLKLHSPTSENHCKICLPQGLYSLPDELRLLHWERYPLGSLPRNFNPKNLVELNMPYSNMTKLWKGTKNLENLKRIILSHSRQLTGFPRLSKATNLEHIDLEGCMSLVKVNSSILHHHKLTFLSLKDCSQLRIMPTTVHLESLEVLNLSGCSELKDLKDFSSNLKQLYLAETAITEMPSSVGNLTRLVTLDLENCLRLQHLPPGISKLRALVTLKLSGCSNLKGLPNLDALLRRDSKRPDTEVTTEESTPLNFHSAIQESRDAEEFLPPSEYLSSYEVPNDIEPRVINIPFPSSILHSLASRLYALVSLYLCNAYLVDIPEDLCRLASVKTLDLSKNPFSHIPKSIKEFCKLHSLRLRHCKNLRCLPELPRSLEILSAHGCVSLISFPSSFEKFPRHYTFSNCFALAPEVISKSIGKALEGYWQEHRNMPSFSICIPASTGHKSLHTFQAGSSVRIVLPPGKPRTTSGFALSVVVEFWDKNRNAAGFGIKCICKKIKGDLSSRLERIFYFWAPKEAPTIQKDHMFVFSIAKMHDFLADMVTFEFHPVDWENKLLDGSCTVKRCGVWKIPTSTCYTTLGRKRPSSSVDLEELSSVGQMAPPFKRCRLKRVIETVILILRKRKREKSVSRPTNLAERERRSRISERLRKLQEVVPNMDKQTSSADMLDVVVDYIKDLERQYKILKENRANCKCMNKEKKTM